MKKFFLCLILIFSCATAVIYNVDAKTTVWLGNTWGGANSSCDPSTDPTCFAPDVDDDFSHNCRDFASGLRLVGVLVVIIKYLVPLLIIGKGIIDISSVVLSGNSGELGKKVQKLAISIVAGLLIFFIPNMVNAIFNLVGKNNPTADSKICRGCILEPFGDTCTNAIKNYQR